MQFNQDSTDTTRTGKGKRWKNKCKPSRNSFYDIGCSFPPAQGRSFQNLQARRQRGPYSINVWELVREGLEEAQVRPRSRRRRLVSGGPQPPSVGVWGESVAREAGREARKKAAIGERRPEHARPPTRASTATRSRPLLAPFTFRSPWTPYLFPPGSPSSRSSSSSSSAPRTAAAILRGGTRGTRKEGSNNRWPHWRTAPRRRRRKRHCHWSERAGQPISSRRRLRIQLSAAGGTEEQRGHGWLMRSCPARPRSRGGPGTRAPSRAFGAWPCGRGRGSREGRGRWSRRYPHPRWGGGGAEVSRAWSFVESVWSEMTLQITDSDLWPNSTMSVGLRHWLPRPVCP